MYKTRRRTALVIINSIAAFVFIAVAIALAPQTKINDFRTYSNAFPIVVTAVLFGILLFASVTVYNQMKEKIANRALKSGATLFLTEFIDRLRFCYSLDDFYIAIADILEKEADCAVFYIEKAASYTYYNSPNKVTQENGFMEKLLANFRYEWPEGVFFFDEDGSLLSSSKGARGFFVSSNGEHFYVLSRYTYLFDDEIYSKLYEEFVRFQSRARTIESLSEISELSREWEQLAITQRAFLPPVMPEIKRVKLAAYFRPLINVSGDYYSVLPIDENKTFIMLGDVSGKGMAAALVMGLVMNTVKIRENKEDLPGMIQAIDAAIKSMHLQDKYTVLFMGIIDTEKMKITYINASMSDPLVVTRSPDGYRIKKLTSNCSIVGIIPIDDIEVAEQRLFSGDLIFMSSDGVSEVMNKEKVELGDTELYTDTIKASAAKDPQGFIDDIANLVLSYNGDTRLHDDVTMLVAKVGGK